MQKKSLIRSLAPLLLLLALTQFTACTREEGAEVEAFFIILFSILFIMPLSIGLALAIVYKNSTDRNGVVKGFGLALFFLNVILAFVWTSFMFTAFAESAAFAYNKGVMIAWLLYIAEMAGVVYSGICLFNPPPVPETPIRHAQPRPTAQKPRKDESDEFDLLSDLDEF